MTGKKILVTGGAGFIGSHLVDKLVAQNNCVTVFDDMSTGMIENQQHYTSNPNIRFVKGSVTDKRDVTQLMKDDFDIIFHLAAIVGVEKYCSNPLMTIDVNFLGMRSIAEEALSNNTKIIFTSTSEVYGKNPEIPLREDTHRVLGGTYIARWSYASSKALCEHLLFALHQLYDLPMVIVRPFNIYGPRQLPPLVIPSFIKKVLHGESPVVYGKGKQTRTFTYVEDAVDAIVSVATHKEAEGEVFNIGGTREVTIPKLADLIISICGKTCTLKPTFMSYAEHYGKSYEDIQRRMPDVSKIKRLLGWEAKTSLEDGLLKTVKYWKKRENHNF